jgi:hypothetical protein
MNLLAASCEVSKRISHLILAPRGGEFNPERLKWERIVSIVKDLYLQPRMLDSGKARSVLIVSTWE